MGKAIQGLGVHEHSHRVDDSQWFLNLLGRPCFSLPLIHRVLHLSPLPPSLSRYRGRSYVTDAHALTAVLLSRQVSPEIVGLAFEEAVY